MQFQWNAWMEFRLPPHLWEEPDREDIDTRTQVPTPSTASEDKASQVQEVSAANSTCLLLPIFFLLLILCHLFYPSVTAVKNAYRTLIERDTRAETLRHRHMNLSLCSLPPLLPFSPSLSLSLRVTLIKVNSSTQRRAK